MNIVTTKIPLFVNHIERKALLLISPMSPETIEYSDLQVMNIHVPHLEEYFPVYL